MLPFSVENKIVSESNQLAKLWNIQNSQLIIHHYKCLV